MDADGVRKNEIAEKLRVPPKTVALLRSRFALHCLDDMVREALLRLEGRGRRIVG
jgi:hypothetical protein